MPTASKVKKPTVEPTPELVAVNMRLPAVMVAEAERQVLRLQRYLRGRASPLDVPSVLTMSNVLRLAIQVGLPEISKLSDSLLRDRIHRHGMVRGRRHAPAARAG